MLFLVLLIIFGKLNSKLALDCLIVVLLYQERKLMPALMQVLNSNLTCLRTAGSCKMYLKSANYSASRRAHLIALVFLLLFLLDFLVRFC